LYQMICFLSLCFLIVYLILYFFIYLFIFFYFFFFFSSRRRHTRSDRDWSSDVCSSDFLQTFGVIGLAIGFVIGVASSAVVNSLVKDLINPIVGLVLPTGNLASLNATVTSPVSGKPSVFLYGDFISQVIYFIVIALVVFVM